MPPLTELQLYASYMSKDLSGVFVFGSNLAGRHGAGAARTALGLYGAQYGKGEGHQGRSYAIPTKDESLRTLPIKRIWYYVDQFLAYADMSRDLTFYVTRVGCGLAGYKDEDIAPMFKTASTNVILPGTWLALSGYEPGLDGR